MSEQEQKEHNELTLKWIEGTATPDEIRRCCRLDRKLVNTQK